MTWILKRTVTESFEVNINALDTFCPLIVGSIDSLDRVLKRGGGQMTREAHNWIIEQFELHSDSLYGDKLFSSCADQDTGLELVWREEDE